MWLFVFLLVLDPSVPVQEQIPYTQSARAEMIYIHEIVEEMQEETIDPVWDRLAKCESNQTWDINTGNGFYGGLQFTLSSWRWVGGEGYPHHHSREEQVHRAELLLERQGWEAWPACSLKLGLR